MTLTGEDVQEEKSNLPSGLRVRPLPPTPPIRKIAYMSQSLLCGSFLKWWYPQTIHFNRVFHYKPSILGYHHLRKPSYHPISFAWICMATMRPSDPNIFFQQMVKIWWSFHYHGRICEIKHHLKKQILGITGVPIPQSLLYHPIGFDVGNFLLGFGLSAEPRRTVRPPQVQVHLMKTCKVVSSPQISEWFSLLVWAGGFWFLGSFMKGIVT